MGTAEKDSIEHEITRARDGVGDRIDELDRKLRTQLNFKTIAAEHTPEIVAGGAALGFLVGFGFPKVLRRIIGLSVPLALIAVKIKNHRART